MERKTLWEKYSDEQLAECESFSKEYMEFLSKGKTERECVSLIESELEGKGYITLDEARKRKALLKEGDKVYHTIMGKAIIAFNIGEDALTEGMNILGAHIDSPRLDLKQNPLYEDGGLAYLNTHYYGGIKKYQWVTIPLALHGVVVKKDGSTIKVDIGEKDDDPVFFVSDLLIHVAQEQMEKKASVVIEGEALDIIVGNIPMESEEDDKKASVKNGVLKILKEQYQIEEEDFISAEIEVVPAGKARDAGFDKSMIMSYGQDDRVCAFSSYKAMLSMEKVKKTACCILVDKEEIGSVGATGMQSKFFENVVAEILELTGKYDELSLRRCLAKSRMLSSDVSSAFDPSYANAFDKMNVAFLGKGLVLNKYTGARGKSGSNDASAEYLAYLRKIFAEEDVQFQTGEIGRVDLGGGGTIAYILALYGMEVIDCGVPVLNMHAPWEVTSKADVYEAMRGYLAFLKN